jgi:hypothetical protein
MPRIFDNIEKELLPALQETIKLSDRADFCVGYFNLRGWRQIDSFIERWSGEDASCCRLLVGMQRAVEQDLRQWLGLASRDEGLDNQAALKFKKQLAAEFRHQLMLGVPTDEDEAGNKNPGSCQPACARRAGRHRAGRGLVSAVSNPTSLTDTQAKFLRAAVLSERMAGWRG